MPGEKEKENVAGPRPPTPREDQPPTPPAVEMSMSEHDITVENILRTNIDGLDNNMNRTEQQAIASKKETKVQTMKRQIKNYLTANPWRCQDRKTTLTIQKNRFMTLSRMRKDTKLPL